MKKGWCWGLRKINNNGYTLIEMVVSMAIIFVFFAIAATLMSAGNKIYVEATVNSNSTGIVETIADDIKGYIAYGEDIEVYYRVTTEEFMVGGIDMSPYPLGTIVHPDGSYYPPEDSGEAPGLVIFTAPYYSNTIDLGYKVISVATNSQGDYIEGLPYGSDYYGRLQLKLKIIENDVDQTLVPGEIVNRVFSVEVTGEIGNDTISVVSNVAMTGLNNK